MKKDEGKDFTDLIFAGLKDDIAAIYDEAEKELKPDIDAYFKKFTKKDNEKRDAYENGIITKEEYKQWRIKNIMGGNEYDVLSDKIAKRYLKANKDAAELTNSARLKVFALNHNYGMYEVGRVYNIGDMGSVQ